VKEGGEGRGAQNGEVWNTGGEGVGSGGDNSGLGGLQEIDRVEAKRRHCG